MPALGARERPAFQNSFAAAAPPLDQAIRQVSGQPVAVAYELRDDVELEAASAVSPEELFERFKDEFDGEEIFDDHQEGGT